MNLSGYLIRRLLLMIPMLIGVTLLVFITTHLVPTNPILVIVGEKGMDNPKVVQAATEKWGLDKPLAEQYFIYLKNLASGDFGVSFKTKRPVGADLMEFLPATIELAIGSMIFAILIGLPLGILAAIKRGSWLDHLSRLVSLLGASMPPFWSGLIVLFLFYYKLPIFPGPGRLDSRITMPEPITGLLVFDSLITGNWPIFWNALHHLVLPSIVLGWFTLALICRITRSAMIEVMSMDYIRTARGKGLAEKMVIFRHAIQNALIPVVTVMGLAFASELSGAIMTETIFAWPGIGRYAVQSAVNLDYPALMGVTLLIAFIYMLANLVVDVTYGLIDPRIREQ